VGRAVCVLELTDCVEAGLGVVELHEDVVAHVVAKSAKVWAGERRVTLFVVAAEGAAVEVGTALDERNRADHRCGPARPAAARIRSTAV